jgi:hypothetical protein
LVKGVLTIMHDGVDLGALASVLFATCWGIVIMWRLVWVVRHLAGAGSVLTRGQVELLLRLTCGIALLSVAASYVAVALAWGLRLPYTWLGAHGWLILPFFLANTVLFAQAVLPAR